MKYIDIHGHIYFPDYNNEKSVGIGDREEAIKRAHDAGVGIISVADDMESSKMIVEMVEGRDEMWAIVGVHPTNSKIFDYETLKKLALDPKVVAIGECGLDYFHPGPTNILESEYRALQKEIFIKHVELANEVKKPLMLHVRNGKDVNAVSDVSAYQEAVAILKEHAKVPANFHFFAGSEQDLSEIIKIGASISFTGVITFARNYDEQIRKVPIDRIMSETDCPFVAPVPYRGKRNEPLYVIEVVKKIAEIRGEPVDKIAMQLVENAKKFFRI